MASLDKIKICYYNARSVRAKSRADEIFDFVCKEEVDVVLLCETWLKPENSFYHKDYKVYRLDRPGNTLGGGVAVAVRKCIFHKLISYQNLQVVESIGITIPTTSGDIDLFSVYYPGTSYSNAIF